VQGATVRPNCYSVGVVRQEKCPTLSITIAADNRLHAGEEAMVVPPAPTVMSASIPCQVAPQAMISDPR